MDWRSEKNKFIRLATLMTLLSFLFGCKQLPIKGPDYSDVIPKVIHLSTGKTIEYEMPGNMTKEFNYAQRYKNESERTLNVDLADDSKYKQDTWQTAFTIDGASWDYLAGKSQGMKGKMGNITLNIFAGRYTGNIQHFITSSYEAYLNGPKGNNTRVRKFGADQGIGMVDLSHRLVKSPDSFDARKIGNAEFVHWTMKNEHPGRFHSYFICVVDDTHYVAFSFYHHFTLASEEELEGMESNVRGDIEDFMSRVIIRESGRG